MADESKTPRTLTEDEAYAIAADRVTRETAELNGKVTTLETEKAELQTKLDVAEAAVSTEKAAKEAAVTELTEFKAKVDTDREIASRTEERTAKVREVAAHLKDDFYTPERAVRWATMDDVAFTEYVAELAAVTGTAPGAPASTDGPPRETAMTGTPATPPKATGNAAQLFNIKRKGA